MALAQTTTLRVSTELRDEISRLAHQRGSTMIDVVTEAVQRLTRDEWWKSVRGALDNLDTAEAAAYRTESDELDAASADGFG